MSFIPLVYINLVMYYDPSGCFAITTFLIIVGVGALIGGTVGGISAGVNGTNVWEGIGKGLLVGAALGVAVGLTAAGIAMGLGTIGGNLMFCYGASVTLNMLEVAVTQGKKSAYDGDNFGAGLNDIVNSMFANTGRIAAGRLDVLGFGFLGTRIFSKAPTAYSLFNIFNITRANGGYNAMDGISGLQAFGVAVSSYFHQPVSPISRVIGYGITAWQGINLDRAIFGNPDFESSRWILY